MMTDGLVVDGVTDQPRTRVAEAATTETPGVVEQMLALP